MDFLKADALPWLAESQQQLRDSNRAARLPHSSLLSSTPGLGAEHLANWMAALALCETPERPCGVCASCLLLKADTHPDYHLVKLEEDAQQIKVDQVRELIAMLALKSYRGGYKVGVIEGAEALNMNAANAFLKTLEEPAANTLLVMIARPTHRLSLAGGAPLLALELQASGLAALESDMQDALRAIGAGAVDVTLLADQWARSNLPLRIAWLENWITRRVHTYLGEENSDQTAERVRLPAALLKPKIRALFELLDAARDMRRLASTGMNQQLALEALLLGGRSVLVPRGVGTVVIAKSK